MAINKRRTGRKYSPVDNWQVVLYRIFDGTKWNLNIVWYSFGLLRLDSDKNKIWQRIWQLLYSDWLRDLSSQSHFSQKWFRWLLNRCSTVCYIFFFIKQNQWKEEYIMYLNFYGGISQRSIFITDSTAIKLLKPQKCTVQVQRR